MSIEIEVQKTSKLQLQFDRNIVKNLTIQGRKKIAPFEFDE